MDDEAEAQPKIALIFFCQITTNAQRNPSSVSMVPPVNKLGHPPGVSIHLVYKEIDVMCVQRGSREMVAKNVLLVSKEMTVDNALSVSRV